MTNANPAGRSTSINSARTRPTIGFIAPCEPTLVTHPPGGAGWIHEISNDGYRLIARRNADTAALWNREATNVIDHFARIASAIQTMNVESITLDGEALVVLPDGRYAAAPQQSTISNNAIMLVFDLLELNGEDIRPKFLRQRRAILAELLANTGDQFIFSEAFVDNRAAIFRQVRNVGPKGIVSKRSDRPYQSGSSATWVKTITSIDRRRIATPRFR